ncbi:site-specific integrase [soil metagenome]
MSNYVKIHCREKRIKSDGTAPVVYKIILGRNNTLINSGKFVEPRYFDNNTQLVTGGGNKLKLNSFFKIDKEKIESIILDLELKNEEITGEKIRARMNGTDFTKPSSENDFILFWKSQMKDIDKNKTQHYQGLRDIKKYCPNGLPFRDLSINWLERYRNHFIKEGRKVNGYAHNFRSIRFMQLRAVKQKLMPESLFGKHGFKIETEEVQKEFLYEEEMDRLYALLFKNKDVVNWIRLTKEEKETAQPPSSNEISFRLKKTLYWFLFSMETALRFGDMLKVSTAIAKGKDHYYIRDNNLFAKTGKTGTVIRIPLTENAKELLEIPMNEPLKKQNHLVNKDLAEIFTHQDIAIDRHITFHASRHTFAIDGLRNDMNLKAISVVMGHKSIMQTEGYAKYENKALDKEMEKKNSKSIFENLKNAKIMKEQQYQALQDDLQKLIKNGFKGNAEDLTKRISEIMNQINELKK